MTRQYEAARERAGACALRYFRRLRPVDRACERLRVSLELRLSASSSFASSDRRSIAVSSLSRTIRRLLQQLLSEGSDLRLS